MRCGKVVVGQRACWIFVFWQRTMGKRALDVCGKGKKLKLGGYTLFGMEGYGGDKVFSAVSGTVLSSSV